MFLSEHSTKETQSTNGKQLQPNKRVVAKLLPILRVVEQHLRLLVRKPSHQNSIDPVFRSMSGVFRYAAQEGLEDVCDLAYEVAQAFAPSKLNSPQATKRVASLSLMAISQMRHLLCPWEEGKEQHARDIVLGLLTKQ